jgi:hypothetical protein
MTKHISLLTLFLLSIIINIKGQVIFPDIEGWKKSEEIKTYDKEDLWEHINGAASYYLKYGFEKLEIAEYSISNDEYISTEVYHHSSPLMTFGIYAFERPNKSSFLDIASEAYLEETALNLYGNNYYIKIRTSQNDTTSIQTMEKIARAIVATNLQNTQKIKALDLFPEKNKIAYGEKYFPANYMGHDFLKNALECSYIINNETLKLFIINCRNKKEKKEILDSYFKFAEIHPKSTKEKMCQINDIFNGLVLITEKENSLYGVSGTSNKNLAKEYLKMMMQ